MIPGKFTLKGCDTVNKKQIQRSLFRCNKRQKVKRQALRSKKLKKGDKKNFNCTFIHQGGVGAQLFFYFFFTHYVTMPNGNNYLKVHYGNVSLY